MTERHNPFIVSEEPPEPPKDSVSKNSVLQVTASVLTIAAIVLGWTKNSHRNTQLLIGLVVLVLLAGAYPRAAKIVRKLVQRRREAHFVRREELVFCDQLRRFAQFVSVNSGSSLLGILHSAFSQQPRERALVPGVNQSITYILRWQECFEQRLTVPANGLAPFMMRCQEFSVIVDQFNRDYVVATQVQLECMEPLSAYYLDQLEHFRDEFNAYLRDMEQWAERVARVSSII